ncbi:MAG: hypothetical protein CMN30_34030 [Sandaracinus sp.]|nr:hypothetical protein [Sandaracinus sp.]
MSGPTVGRELPLVDPLARRVDTARMRRVEAVLAAGAARVAECRTLLDRPAAGLERLDTHARALLADLRAAGPLTRIDARVRSERHEILDSPDVPPRVRQRAMRRLEALNERAGAHAIFLRTLDQVLGDHPAPHVYELAAGTGGLARRHGAALRRRRRGLRWTISDLDERVLGASEREWLRAERRDVLALSELEGVDLFLCVQAAHHLPPGVLLGLFAQARSAPLGLLVLDVHRGPLVAGLAGLAGLALGRDRIVALDGIQSARRAFLPAELALLARVAGLRVRRVGPLGPAYLALHAVGGGRGDELP